MGDPDVDALRDAVRLADLHAAARRHDAADVPTGVPPQAPPRRHESPAAHGEPVPDPPGPPCRLGTIRVPRDRRS